MRASEILWELKARDNHTTFAMAMSNPTYMKLLAAWAAVATPGQQIPDEECPPDTPPHLRVRWLWSLVEPDPIPAWIEMAGLPDAAHTRRACRVLVDNAVVLPDGSLAEAVDEYLRLRYDAAVAALTPREERDG